MNFRERVDNLHLCDHATVGNVLDFYISNQVCCPGFIFIFTSDILSLVSVSSYRYITVVKMTSIVSQDERLMHSWIQNYWFNGWWMSIVRCGYIAFVQLGTVLYEKSVLSITAISTWNGEYKLLAVIINQQVYITAKTRYYRRSFSSEGKAAWQQHLSVNVSPPVTCTANSDWN